MCTFLMIKQAIILYYRALSQKIRTYEIIINHIVIILLTLPGDGPGPVIGEGNENIEDDKNQKIDIRHRCPG